jgi:hypothetical protein
MLTLWIPAHSITVCASLIILLKHKIDHISRRTKDPRAGADIVSAIPLGPRITCIQAEPLEFFCARDPSTPRYDVAVLAHCLWYSASPTLILETLCVLSAHARLVCIAEWSLSCAEGTNGMTHILAVLTQAALECLKRAPTYNIRATNVHTVVSPVVLPLSGSEPIPNLNRTRTEPQFRFRQWQRSGPNPRCGSGFDDYWIFPDLFEHVRTCTNLKFSLLQITIFANQKSRTRTFLATDVS